MRVRRLVRVAGHVAGSRALGSVHAIRRWHDPDGWSRHDPNRMHWVTPAAVVATTAHRLELGVRGRRLGGDWDRSALPLDRLSLWRGLEQRIVEGRAWEATDLAPGRFVVEAPNVGGRLTNDDQSSLRARWERLDYLIASLSQDGWLPHHDVGARFTREMAVAIGRSGELVRDSGGLHRIIIARLLDLPHIPCRVLTEHTDAPDVGLSRRRIAQSSPAA